MAHKICLRFLCALALEANMQRKGTDKAALHHRDDGAFPFFSVNPSKKGGRRAMRDLGRRVPLRRPTYHQRRLSFSFFVLWTSAYHLPNPLFFFFCFA